MRELFIGLAVSNKEVRSAFVEVLPVSLAGSMDEAVKKAAERGVS